MLDANLLVTWYGNPHSARMGILGEQAGRGARGFDARRLNIDGFGSQSLKLSSYRAVMRQYALSFAGIKPFYRQDTGLFTPAQVMQLRPMPSVVIYQ